MSKKQKKAVFHIELDGNRFHTDIYGNAIDLIKCLCAAMAHDKHIAWLICAVAKAWNDFNEKNAAGETTGNEQANQQ